MRGGVLVDPVFLFIGHAVATGNLSGWTEVTAPDQAIFSFIDSSFEFSKFGDPESGGNGRLI